jgi:hypothetical protein
VHAAAAAGVEKQYRAAMEANVIDI